MLGAVKQSFIAEVKKLEISDQKTVTKWFDGF